MKKLFLLIPVLLFSCTKKEVVATTPANSDSTEAIDKNVVEHSRDSVREGVLSIDSVQNLKEISQTFRAVDGNKIIKTLNGDMLPMKITDEFTKADQQLILKIKNFNAPKISGTIVPENPKMNIRFTQIKLANGDYDGPFGRDITYEIKEKGEIWLLVGKSNMASGETKGKFTVNLR